MEGSIRIGERKNYTHVNFIHKDWNNEVTRALPKNSDLKGLRFYKLMLYEGTQDIDKLQSMANLNAHLVGGSSINVTGIQIPFWELYLARSTEENLPSDV